LRSRFTTKHGEKREFPRLPQLFEAAFQNPTDFCYASRC